MCGELNTSIQISDFENQRLWMCLRIRVCENVRLWKRKSIRNERLHKNERPWKQTSVKTNVYENQHLWKSAVNGTIQVTSCLTAPCWWVQNIGVYLWCLNTEINTKLCKKRYSLAINIVIKYTTKISRNW